MPSESDIEQKDRDAAKRDGSETAVERQKRLARERSRAWYSENKGRVLPRMRARYHEKREEILAQGRVYVAANKDKIRVRQKQWCVENRDRLRERARERYEKDPQAAVAKTRARRARDPLMAIARSLVHGAKARAAARGDGFDEKKLTVATVASSLRSEPRCPCCKRLFTIEVHTGRKAQAPSIDRFDSSMGYIAGNWLIICWRCNVIKRDASAAELRCVADWMDAEGL